MESVSARREESGAWREWLNLFLLGSITLVSYWGVTRSYYVLFWFAATIGVVASLFMLAQIGSLVFHPDHAKKRVRPLHNVALVVGGTMFAVICIEGFLWWREPVPSATQVKRVESAADKEALQTKASLMGASLEPEAVAQMVKRQGILTLPQEWEHQELAPLPGTKRRYLWHGVVHVFDKNNFRRSATFPPKDPHVFRIMVIGDSLTYGQGVQERFIYPSLLEARLAKEYAVEVLNLGVQGYQSEDILSALTQFLPRLDPDIVIYGVCLNDFLPSKIGQYPTRGYEFPLPERMQRVLSERSRVARFVADLYDRLLRTAGLRADFFDDILKDFGGYQQRFRRDVAAMNAFVTSQGLPPIVAMVLDQFPYYGGRGHRIAQSAETYLKEAGMDVIETEEYYRLLDGHVMPVTVWEGHPNEEAHAIFSSMIYHQVRAHPKLQPFKRQSS